MIYYMYTILVLCQQPWFKCSTFQVGTNKEFSRLQIILLMNFSSSSCKRRPCLGGPTISHIRHRIVRDTAVCYIISLCIPHSLHPSSSSLILQSPARWGHMHVKLLRLLLLLLLLLHLILLHLLHLKLLLLHHHHLMMLLLCSESCGVLLLRARCSG